MHKFQPGDAFPRLQGPTLQHGTLTLPDDIPAGAYGIVLAYRAHW